MPKYVIEREIPGAGNLTAAELTAVADTSRTFPPHQRLRPCPR